MKKGRPVELPGRVKFKVSFTGAEAKAICRLAQQADVSVSVQVRTLVLAALTIRAEEGSS